MGLFSSWLNAKSSTTKKGPEIRFHGDSIRLKDLLTQQSFFLDQLLSPRIPESNPNFCPAAYFLGVFSIFSAGT